MNRGRRGDNIFQAKEDYLAFFDLLEELNEVFHVRVAAYCLMANHYQLLVQTPDANLSRAMRQRNPGRNPKAICHEKPAINNRQHKLY
jgi:putative transposase